MLKHKNLVTPSLVKLFTIFFSFFFFFFVKSYIPLQLKSERLKKTLV